MGLSYRRRVGGRRAWLNLSKSGVSGSVKPTDRVTINSRGRITVRLFKGLTYRANLPK